MIEPFDDLFEDSPRRATTTYVTVPQGQHEVEIVSATVGPLPWNAGEHLRLRLSAGPQYRYIFADIHRDKAWLFKALAAALDIQPGADGKVTFGPPEELVGRCVRIEVSHYVAKTGEHRAAVKRWLPSRTSHRTSRPGAMQQPGGTTTNGMAF